MRISLRASLAGAGFVDTTEIEAMRRNQNELRRFKAERIKQMTDEQIDWIAGAIAILLSVVAVIGFCAKIYVRCKS